MEIILIILGIVFVVWGLHSINFLLYENGTLKNKVESLENQLKMYKQK